MRGAIRWLATIAVLSALAISCGQARTDFEDCFRVQADIRSDLGVDTAVGLVTLSPRGGSTTRKVTVRLRGRFTGDLAKLKASVRAIVLRDFHSHVDAVDVLF